MVKSHLRIISIRVIESDLHFRNIRHVALRRLNRGDASGVAQSWT